MPEHLEELVLREKVDNLIANLELWLQENGQYTSITGKKDLLKYVNDRWKEEAFPIGDKVSTLISKVALQPRSIVLRL
jgi:hypothetical protein